MLPQLVNELYLLATGQVPLKTKGTERHRPSGAARHVKEEKMY